MNILWHDMKAFWQGAPTLEPHWDGNRVRFAISIKGKRIPCAISRAALQRISGQQQASAGGLVHDFRDSRDRIEEIATSIFDVTPDGIPGPVSIWADDIDISPSSWVSACQPTDRACGVGRG